MILQRISRQGWFALLGVPALFLCGYILAGQPAMLNLPICGVKLFTGLDCPGCGLTHSIASLTTGHIYQSIMYHPLGVIIALWLFYMFARALISFTLGRPLRPFFSQKARDILLTIFLVALLGLWIFKLFLLISP